MTQSHPDPDRTRLVPPGFVSTIAYAASTGVAHWTLNRLARSGKVQAVRIPGLGNRIWINKDEADKALRPNPLCKI